MLWLVALHVVINPLGFVFTTRILPLFEGSLGKVESYTPYVN